MIPSIYLGDTRRMDSFLRRTSRPAETSSSPGSGLRALDRRRGPSLSSSRRGCEKKRQTGRHGSRLEVGGLRVAQILLFLPLLVLKSKTAHEAEQTALPGGCWGGREPQEPQEAPGTHTIEVRGAGFRWATGSWLGHYLSRKFCRENEPRLRAPRPGRGLAKCLRVSQEEKVEYAALATAQDFEQHFAQ